MESLNPQDWRVAIARTSFERAELMVREARKRLFVTYVELVVISVTVWSLPLERIERNAALASVVTGIGLSLVWLAHYRLRQRKLIVTLRYGEWMTTQPKWEYEAR